MARVWNDEFDKEFFTDEEIEESNKSAEEITEKINEGYCLNCDKRQPYKVLMRKGTIDIRGKVVGFDENYAVCAVCGEVMYVPSVWDSNIESVQRAYDKLKENT